MGVLTAILPMLGENEKNFDFKRCFCFGCFYLSQCRLTLKQIIGMQQATFFPVLEINKVTFHTKCMLLRDLYEDIFHIALR